MTLYQFNASIRMEQLSAILPTRVRFFKTVTFEH